MKIPPNYSLKLVSIRDHNNKELQKILEHKSSKTTMIHAHNSEDHLDNLVELIAHPNFAEQDQFAQYFVLSRFAGIGLEIRPFRYC